MLGREHVLTCAHVALGAPDLAVDMMGLDGKPGLDAQVVEDLCVPESPDHQRGDVALLKLGKPLPDGNGATLRRATMTWDRPVCALGYPDGIPYGVWARMTLAGQVGFEWVQMNRRSEVEQRVRAGFSGSGIVDGLTGDVLGIVVTEYTDDNAGLSWMLPTDAIMTYLPLVSEWAVGDSGVDPSFARPVHNVERAGRTAELTKVLVDWFRRRQDGPAVLVVLGQDLDAVRQAVTLSHPNSADLAPVDLALDVEGQTVDEVSRRIANRVGLPQGDARTPGERLSVGTPPMTVVAIEVDRAEEPEALLDEVFTPMVRNGARIVLGFRDGDSTSMTMARTLVTDAIMARLNGFDTRIAALAMAGDRLADHVTELRVRLTELRLAVPEDPERVAERLLPRFDRRIAKVERELATQDRCAAAISADRGLLEATKARAADGGLVEHAELAQLYRAAIQLLTENPVDEVAVHTAVRVYGDAVRQTLATGSKEGR